MPTKQQEGKTVRIAVPPVGDAYREMQSTKKAEDETAKRERRRGEKGTEHLEHEKTKAYGERLPPAENRIRTEHPPFNKK